MWRKENSASEVSNVVLKGSILLNMKLRPSRIHKPVFDARLSQYLFLWMFVPKYGLSRLTGFDWSVGRLLILNWRWSRRRADSGIVIGSVCFQRRVGLSQCFWVSPGGISMEQLQISCTRRGSNSDRMLEAVCSSFWLKDVSSASLCAAGSNDLLGPTA